MKLHLKTFLLGALVITNSVRAQTADENAAESDISPNSPGKWSTTLSGGFVHQFETSLDDMPGDFDVSSFAVRAGVSYAPDFMKIISLNLGYGHNDYNFSTSGPWSNIDSVRLSAPVQWGIDQHWMLFALPVVQWNAEDGADVGDSLTAGGMVGFSYRFSERLTIGPGVGVTSELEDSVSVFPILIINWKITEKLTLETGRTLGASQGPGLMLSYALAEEWSLLAGGRYEKFRFRLSEDGTTPDGVGEDRGIPLYLGATYQWKQYGSVTLLGGVKFGGELSVDDASGNKIGQSDYDPSPFLGFSFNAKF